MSFCTRISLQSDRPINSGIKESSTHRHVDSFSSLGRSKLGIDGEPIKAVKARSLYPLGQHCLLLCHKGVLEVWIGFARLRIMGNDHRRSLPIKDLHPYALRLGYFSLKALLSKVFKEKYLPKYLVLYQIKNCIIGQQKPGNIGDVMSSPGSNVATKPN